MNVRRNLRLLVATGCVCLSFVACNASESSDAHSDSVAEEPSNQGTPATENETQAGRPFKGAAAQIPGVVEAEDFDEGEPGQAYEDADESNLGAENYREPTQVDIEERNDASGGFGIGWTRKGEWLQYSVLVKKPGSYSIHIPVASAGLGGTFHLEFGREDVTGPIQIPDTVEWTKLQVITVNDVLLQEGLQTMRLVLDSEGASGNVGDIDRFEFVSEPD